MLFDLGAAGGTYFAWRLGRAFYYFLTAAWRRYGPAVQPVLVGYHQPGMDHQPGLNLPAAAAVLPAAAVPPPMVQVGVQLDEVPLILQPYFTCPWVRSSRFRHQAVSRLLASSSLAYLCVQCHLQRPANWRALGEPMLSF